MTKNRIEVKFRELKKEGRKAFIAFITAGYPDLTVTKKLVLEFDKIGVDIIELGVPFSDPLADGPVIQESSEEALKHKVNIPLILKLVKDIRRHSGVPICLMTYYNPVFCFGEERFTKEARQAGVDGVIIPDLPPEEAGSLIRYAGKYGLATIFFLSPTSSIRRMKLISKASKGFIYYVSLTGVTGARMKLACGLIKNIKLIKKYARKPICVGFGVSRPEQVKEIKRVADGIIVGSAIVGKIRENIGKPGLVNKTSNFVSRLKDV
ncbi:MAG: tryptophan synthase subunit alpha [Candidatus Omnitrophota bacterium]